MLVVIGIIGVLISILLPSLGAARRNARTIACAAKLRSIGQACNAHTTEHRGYLPLAGELVFGPTITMRSLDVGLKDGYRQRYNYVPIDSAQVNVMPFIAALAPQLGVHNIPSENWDVMDQALNSKDGVWKHFMCPDTDSIEKGGVGVSAGDHTVEGQGMMMVCITRGGRSAWSTNSDYAVNEGVFGFHYDSTYQMNRLAGQMSAIRNPVNVVLFADAIPRKTAADPLLNAGWLAWTPTLTNVGPASLGDALAGNPRAQSADNFDLNRHGKRINVLFADGHVETFPITPEALSEVYLVPP